MSKTQISPKRFGEQMTKLREATKMTVEQVADKSGMDVSRLKEIEAGTVEKVTKKDCKRIGKVLQIPKPVVKFLGVDPEETGGFAELATMTQDAIFALVVAQVEYHGKIDKAANGKAASKAVNGKSKKKIPIKKKK